MLSTSFPLKLHTIMVYILTHLNYTTNSLILLICLIYRKDQWQKKFTNYLYGVLEVTSELTNWKKRISLLPRNSYILFGMIERAHDSQ